MENPFLPDCGDHVSVEDIRAKARRLDKLNMLRWNQVGGELYHALLSGQATERQQAVAAVAMLIFHSFVAEQAAKEAAGEVKH